MHIYIYSCISKVCLHVTFLQWDKCNIFLPLTGSYGSPVDKVTFVKDEGVCFFFMLNHGDDQV